jgi:hypothetical protein
MTRALLACLLLTGCTHEIVRYERVNVAVPVLPEVPAHLLEDYPGGLPRASEAGVICFGEKDAKSLQEWMLWHKLKLDQFRGVLIND